MKEIISSIEVANLKWNFSQEEESKVNNSKWKNKLVVFQMRHTKGKKSSFIFQNLSSIREYISFLTYFTVIKSVKLHH